MISAQRWNLHTFPPLDDYLSIGQKTGKSHICQRCTPNENREAVFYEVSLLVLSGDSIFILQSLTNSDYNTVSVAQSKTLVDRKSASLTNYEVLMRAGFFLCFLSKKKYCM